MTKNELIQRIKNRTSAAPRRTQKSVRTYRRFSTALRRKLKNAMPMLKRAALTSLFGAATFFPVQQTEPMASPSASRRMAFTAAAEQFRQEKIEQLVTARTEDLKKQIISNVDSLQNIIRKSSPNVKNKIVAKMFDRVYTNCGLNAEFNYCVAGAIFARITCKDPLLNKLLPDPNKKVKDYYPLQGNHPNVTCTTMRQFFKDTFGSNYAERGNKNFKQFIQTLEEGDLLTVSSSRNTSTGEHCLTCAGPVQNGMLPVKGFNGEKDYRVPLSQIKGAIKMMQQYRQMLTLELQNQMDLEQFMPIVGNRDDILYDDYANSSRQKMKEQASSGQALENLPKIETKTALNNNSGAAASIELAKVLRQVRQKS